MRQLAVVVLLVGPLAPRGAQAELPRLRVAVQELRTRARDVFSLSSRAWDMPIPVRKRDGRLYCDLRGGANLDAAGRHATRLANRFSRPVSFTVNEGAGLQCPVVAYPGQRPLGWLRGLFTPSASVGRMRDQTRALGTPVEGLVRGQRVVVGPIEPDPGRR